MSVQLQIPDSVVQAICLPEERVRQELRVELAIALYAQGLLSFGKAKELAETGKYEFGRLLGAQGIARHYSREELEDDLVYGRGEQPLACSEPGNYRPAFAAAPAVRRGMDSGSRAGRVAN